MTTPTAMDHLTSHNEIRISIEFVGSLPHFIDGAVALDDIPAHIASAEAKMDEVGITPSDRLYFASDIFTRLSIIPPANEREVQACVDLALWLAHAQGTLDELAPDGSNWLRLSWSALMSETRLPDPSLENSLRA